MYMIMMMLVSIYVCTLRKKAKTVYGEIYTVDNDTKGNHIKEGRNKV